MPSCEFSCVACDGKALWSVVDFSGQYKTDQASIGTAIKEGNGIGLDTY